MTLLKRINRSYYNSMAHLTVMDAYNSGVINSEQMHIILGNWNRKCWPEWKHPLAAEIELAAKQGPTNVEAQKTSRKFMIG